jgi:hypothetical protein
MPLLLALYLDPADNEHMIQMSCLPSIVCTINNLTTLKFQIYEQVHLSIWWDTSGSSILQFLHFNMPHRVTHGRIF